MISAGVAWFAAMAMVGGPWSRPPLMELGSDPSRGLLVNRTLGARPWDAPDPSRPTLVFIHGFNPTPRTIRFTMGTRFAEAMARRGGPPFNVLSWDWNAATVVSMRPSTNAESTIQQGFALAEAIRGSGIDPARTHLVGHSSGCIVAAAAARRLTDGYSRPAAQLTLLEPAGFYHSVVFERLSAGTSAACVENYWSPAPSGYGRPVDLPGVQNRRLDGPSPVLGTFSPAHSNHLAVVRWYLDTIANPALSAGFNTSVMVGAGT